MSSILRFAGSTVKLIFTLYFAVLMLIIFTVVFANVLFAVTT